MTQKLPGLTEALAAGGALEEVIHAVNVLVVQQVGRLQEALVAQVAFEGAVGGGLVCAPMPHQGVLLFKAHLAVFAMKRTFFGVRTLVLPQVGRTLEALTARGAAERPGALRLTLVVQKLGRLFEMQLAEVALEQVLTRVGIHVTHEVRAMLKALLAHCALERPFGAVRALMVG